MDVQKLNPSLNQKGIALIMVLWVITILSMVVLEFSFAMRSEVQITRNFQEELQLYAMAEGGVERAIAELVYKTDPKTQDLRKNQLPEKVVNPEKGEWMTDGRSYLLPFSRGECDVRVMGEGGKININQASEKLLRTIIGNLGLDGEQRDTVVDSILDWRDPDDLHRANGAENDYYQALPQPYNSKNGNLDSVEELLLIRGVTPDLFYGKKSSKDAMGSVGLKDIFTIYSTGETIDINSATLPVLRFVLGIPLEISKLTIKAREEKGFESQQDLLQRVPELSSYYDAIGRQMQYRNTIPYFTVEAKARSKEGGSVRGLRAIIKVDPKEQANRKIIQWLDMFI